MDSGQFIKVPVYIEADKRLSPTDKAVYMALRKHRNERSGEEVFPSRELIGKSVGRGVTTVWRSLKNLANCGHIVWKSGAQGRSNRYQFTHETVSSSPVQSSHVANEPLSSSSANHESESGTQKQESDNSSLFFRGELCLINEDGTSVQVIGNDGFLTPYDGRSDSDFRYRNLTGPKALRVALHDYQMQAFGFARNS